MFLKILIILSFNLFFSCAFAESHNAHAIFSDKDKQLLGILISSKHYQKPNIDEAVLKTPSTLNKYLKQLDPYSSYLSKDEVIFKKSRAETERTGVGLDLLIDDQLILAVPVKDGPAYKAGITKPIYICKINKQEIKANNFESYQFLSKFKEGQLVEIEAMAKVGSQIKTYQIEVEKLTQKHITFKKYDDFDILNIRQFSNENTLNIKKRLKNLSRSKPLIIDLRHNPGGDLYATIDTLSFFLKKDHTIAYLKENNSFDPIPLKTVSGEFISNRKIIVVLSRFTASSAEVFAQALKTLYSQVKFIGLNTAGKCLAQETHETQSGAAVKLSVFEVLDAHKKQCQNTPLVADIKIDHIETMNYEQIINALR